MSNSNLSHFRDSLLQLEPGTALPTLVTKKVTRHDLALFCGGSGDHNPIHTDSDFARQAGMDDVIVQGMLTMAYAGRMLTNWIDPRRLKSFRVRFRAVTHVGAPVTCKGTIVSREQEDGRTILRIALRALQNDRETLSGEAIVYG